MKWYIRRVVKKGKGALEYQDDEHYGDTLNIGRASSQAIYVPDLRVALEHAKVSALASGTTYRVESLIAAGVRINGQRTQAAVISKGDYVDIGTVRLSFIEAPPGFAAGVEITPIDKSEQAALQEAERLPNRLTETRLSKRKPSYILFFGLLTFCLLIPLAAHVLPSFGKRFAGSALSTQIWNSGPLAAAHHEIAGECKQCHLVGFTSVQNTQCLACHQQTKAHVNERVFSHVADGPCAQCHRDHNGKTGLVQRGQSLCSDCHSDLKTLTKNVSKLPAYTDFGTGHPQFKINLPAWNAAGEFTPQRVSMDSKTLREQSGLKYPHSKHVGLVDGLQSPSGRRVLRCSSCHQQEAGGARMQPVDFETMCQSCHQLGFDRLAAERQVPHAKIAEVLAQLSDYYAKRALDGDYEEAAAPAVVRRRRIPGQVAAALSVEEKRVAISWAREKASLVARTLFEGRACGVCHTVTRLANNDEGIPNYSVAPVRVAGSWFSKSRFTHDKHSTMDCAGCHKAEQSTSSADVLMPEITTCRSCHGGEHASTGLQSTCIDCHGFHQSPFPYHLRTSATPSRLPSRPQ
jgi:predicted CXXCH cytochrome family protein